MNFQFDFSQKRAPHRFAALFFAPSAARICLSLRQRFSATLFGSVSSSVSAISTPIFAASGFPDV